MKKLYVVDVVKTYVVAAYSEQDAKEAFEECDDYDTEVFEDVSIKIASQSNVNKSWANYEPSNLFGKKLVELAPELFK